ncbi:hypothetical protein AVEN_268119-1 [Araneus ventricosus]|uniref:GAIN-B domain-containing protein n=1 Tax=Araneus ventricosus TaxID=182803 RepID=A0A4Y2RFM6_ARAVE|nr:hypothetical protein AVEN_268119-1 [Araneus ventricosus]
MSQELKKETKSITVPQAVTLPTIEVFDLCKNQKWQELDLSLTSQGIGKVYLPGNLDVNQDTFCNKPVQRGILAGYKNIESYLSPNSSSSMKIISGIIGVSLGDFNESYSFPENQTVRIILKHPPTSSETTRVCVFLNWNYEESNSTYGVWDNRGCKVVKSEEKFTECECNHLTNFAILMDFAGPEFQEKDELSLLEIPTRNSPRNMSTLNNESFQHLFQEKDDLLLNFSLEYVLFLPVALSLTDHHLYLTVKKSKEEFIAELRTYSLFSRFCTPDISDIQNMIHAFHLS